MGGVCSMIHTVAQGVLGRIWCHVEHISATGAMWSTSSVQSLLSGSNFPVPPLVAGLVTLQLFQNASLEFSWYFSYVFSFLLL